MESRRTRALLVVVVVACVAIAVLTLGDPAVPAMGPSTRDQAAAVPNERRGAAARDDSELVLEREALGAASDVEPIVISGLVVDAAHGTPIGAATVEALAPFTASATTASDGAFQLRGDVKAASTLWLRATAGDHLPRTVVVNGPPRTNVTLALQPAGQGAAVSGRVIDEQTAPVADARVHYREQREREFFDAVVGVTAETITGADGAFRLASLPPGRGQLRVESAHHADHWRHLDLPPGSTTDLGRLLVHDFEWTTLTGVVRTADGAPLAGADVRGHPRGRASTAADGTFRIERLLPGELSLTIEAPTVRRDFDLELPPEREHHVDLVIPSGPHVLAGVVTCEREPVPNVRIGVWCGAYPPRPGTSLHKTTTDGAGRFRLAGLPEPSVVAVVMRGAPEQMPRFENLATDREHVLEVPPLAPPAIVTVSGTVRDADGAPITAARVHGGDPGAPTVQTFSDADGSYAMQIRFGSGTVRIGAERDGHRGTLSSFRAGDVRNGRFVRDLVLPRITATGSIRGMLRRADGNPIRNVPCTIAATWPDGARYETWSDTDATGAFWFEGVPVGTTKLVVAPEKRASIERELAIGRDVETVVDLVVDAQAPGTLEVRVTDAMDRAFAGAEVTVMSPPPLSLPHGSQLTDARGHATLRDVPAGARTVVVVLAGGPHHAADVEVPSGGSLEVPIVVADGPHRLEGTVLRVDGKHADHGMVTLHGASGNARFVRHVVYVERDGQFSFDGLAAGRYRVEVRSATNESDGVEADVPGPPIEVRLRGR